MSELNDDGSSRIIELVRASRKRGRNVIHTGHNVLKYSLITDVGNVLGMSLEDSQEELKALKEIEK